MIAVVGGGITGLSACYELERQGFQDICLFERSDRLGGVILTEKVEGFLIEGGPDCLYTQKPWAIELSKELGLGGELIGPREETRGTYILWKKRLHRLPEGFLLLVPTHSRAFLLSGLLSPWGKVRVLLEPLIPPRRDNRDESLRDFVLRRLGREVLERIAEPLIGGIHGGVPEKLSAEAVLPSFREWERMYGSILRGLRRHRPSGQGVPFVTFREGMQELVEAIASSLRRTKALLGWEFKGIEPRGRGLLLHFNHGKVEAEAVILAIPSYEASLGLEEVDPSLSRLLSLIKHAPSAILSLAFRKEDVVGIRGHGFVVPRKEKMRIKAVSFSSEKFPHRAPEGWVLLRVFFGGEEVLGWDERTVLEGAMDELSKVLTFRGVPALWRLHRWPKGLAQMDVGHKGLVAEIRKGLERFRGILLAGGSYDGIGIGDCVRSGRETARALGQGLRGR